MDKAPGYNQPEAQVEEQAITEKAKVDFQSLLKSIPQDNEFTTALKELSNQQPRKIVDSLVCTTPTLSESQADRMILFLQEQLGYKGVSIGKTPYQIEASSYGNTEGNPSGYVVRVEYPIAKGEDENDQEVDTNENQTKAQPNHQELRSELDQPRMKINLRAYSEASKKPSLNKEDLPQRRVTEGDLKGELSQRQEETEKKVKVEINKLKNAQTYGEIIRTLGSINLIRAQGGYDSQIPHDLDPNRTIDVAEVSRNITEYLNKALNKEVVSPDIFSDRQARTITRAYGIREKVVAQAKRELEAKDLAKLTDGNTLLVHMMAALNRQSAIGAVWQGEEGSKEAATDVLNRANLALDAANMSDLNDKLSEWKSFFKLREKIRESVSKRISNINRREAQARRKKNPLLKMQDRLLGK